MRLGATTSQCPSFDFFLMREIERPRLPYDARAPVSFRVMAFSWWDLTTNIPESDSQYTCRDASAHDESSWRWRKNALQKLGH